MEFPILVDYAQLKKIEVFLIEQSGKVAKAIAEKNDSAECHLSQDSYYNIKHDRDDTKKLKELTQQFVRVEDGSA